MQITPEIEIKDVSMTPLIDKLITRGIARLEKVCDYIISVRIALEQAQGRHQQGNPYRMRVTIRIPDRSDIIVERLSTNSRKTITPRDIDGEEEAERNGRSLGRKIPEEPLTALIRRTFDSARRELEKTVDKQHGEVKTPAQLQSQGVVERIFPKQDYGFLRTMDGQQVYFHRNSVLHKHWEKLTVGTAVRYTPEMGEKGLQASTVEPVNKPGVAEIHDHLHSL